MPRERASPAAAGSRCSHPRVFGLRAPARAASLACPSVRFSTLHHILFGTGRDPLTQTGDHSVRCLRAKGCKPCRWFGSTTDIGLKLRLVFPAQTHSGAMATLDPLICSMIDRFYGIHDPSVYRARLDSC